MHHGIGKLSTSMGGTKHAAVEIWRCICDGAACLGICVQVLAPKHCNSLAY